MSLRLLNLSCMKDELGLSYVFWLAMGRWQCTSLTAPALLARCLSIIYGSQQSLGLPLHQSPSSCRTCIPVGCKYRILAEAWLCLELWGVLISPLGACCSQQSCAEDGFRQSCCSLLALGAHLPPPLPQAPAAPRRCQLWAELRDPRGHSLIPGTLLK